MFLGDNMKKATKEKRNTKDMFVENENVASNFVKILIIVAILALTFGLITYAVTHKSTNKTDSTVIQYDKILVGSILNREDDNYYVLVEMSDDSNNSTYESSIDTYNAKDEHLRFYTVDLSDGFNTNYVSDKANLKVTNISDIRFSTTTLLKIENHKIAKTITNSTEIQTFLTDLSA